MVLIFHNVQMMVDINWNNAGRLQTNAGALTIMEINLPNLLLDLLQRAVQVLYIFIPYT